MYIFAKSVVIFLQNRDKINIKKFKKTLIEPGGYALVAHQQQ
jgi:hypothetical protein